jgi:hypothetical protein
MNENLMDQNEVVKYKGEGTAIEQQAVALVVVDEAGRAQAADMREQARQFKKNVETKFSPAREAALKAHREITSLINEMIAPADRVIKITDGKMSAYQLEEDRKHREAQAKIDAEIAAKEQAERDRLNKLAEKQMEAGKFDKAEATIQRAEEVAYVAPVLPTIDKRVVTDAGGTSSRKDFELAIVNSHEVIQAIAAGKIPFGVARHDVAKNEIRITGGSLKDFAKLNQVGDTLPTVPGCRLTLAYKFSGRAK